MRRFFILLLAGIITLSVSGIAAAKKVEVSGEIIDSWCYITEIMYPEGTAHHQCALWCAAGGIPVGLQGDDGNVYIILKVGKDTTNVANANILEIQTNRVSVTGDLHQRDGINYLLINEIVNNEGIVKQTHDDYGIQPFGE